MLCRKEWSGGSEHNFDDFEVFQRLKSTCAGAHHLLVPEHWTLRCRTTPKKQMRQRDEKRTRFTSAGPSVLL